MLEELSAKEFDEFSYHHPLTTYHQSSGWAKVKNYTGWEHRFWGLRKEGKLVAATLVLRKTVAKVFKLYYAPRGFLVDFYDDELLKEFSDAVVKKVKDEGGFVLKVDPYIDTKLLDENAEAVPGGYDHSDLIPKMEKLGYKYQLDENGEPRTTIVHTIYVLDIKDRTEEEILNSFRSKTRQIIHNYPKNGVKVRALKREELYKFKDLMERTSERKGFVDRSLGYYEAVYDAFSKDDTVRFMAAEIDINQTIESVHERMKESQTVYDRLTERKNKNPEKFKAEGQLNETIARLDAAKRKLEEYEALKAKYGDTALLSVNMDFLWGDREVTAVFGGNDPELFGLNGQYALYWEMIKEAKKRGCERFNFMGIPDDISENDPMWGVYQTKKAYHGRVERLIGEFDYVIHPAIYKLYRFAAEKL